MLNAILHGKKRGTGLVATNMQEADGAEDVLTATVFERLAYLPDGLMQEILSRVFGQPLTLGALQQCQFWPRWPLDGQRVEPDLLLSWQHGRVLVEAKRWDDIQQQSPEQLARELAAGLHAGHFATEDYLLVLGGLADDGSFDSLRHKVYLLLADQGLPGQSIQLHGCSWRQFFLTIESVLQAEDDSHLLRLLHDIREVQILPAQWLHQLSLEGDIKHDKMPGFGITRLSQLSAEDKRLTSGLGLAGLPSMSLRWQHVPLGIAPNHS